MENTAIACPYCGAGAEALRPVLGGRFYCGECGRLFDDEDVAVEDIRHRLSALLGGTDETHPRPCEIMLDIPDAFGLSSLEQPMVTGAFEVEGDGTIWLYVYGMDEPMNFDDFDLPVLRQILKEIQN